MNISKTDKILLGITAAVVTSVAAVVHLWLAFVVLVAFVAVAMVLKRISAGQGRAAKTASPKQAASNGQGLVINPATGIPMCGPADARGNLYGQNEAGGGNLYGRHEPY